MSITVEQVLIYPIKSTKGQAVEQSPVEARGLQHDRRWMLVDPQGRFLTGRRFPILTQVLAQPTAAGLQIRAPDGAEITVERPEPGVDDRQINIWKDHLDVADAGDAAADWFSRVIDAPCRLVYMDDHHVRPTDPDFGQAEDQVSLADGYPLLLISQASLDALNDRLPEPVSMGRFRPNLVVSGIDAFAEDRWHRVTIGEVEFEMVKPCARCVFTTVDPETAEKHPDGEPLRTLMEFRRTDDGRVLFGVNLVARSGGIVQHGDPVRVLSTS